MEPSKEELLAELKALKEHTRRLEKAIEGAGLGIWDWHVPTNTTLFNERWAEMVGYTSEEVGDFQEHYDRTVHPDDKEPTQQAVVDHMAGLTESFSRELRLLHKQGHWIWIHSQGRCSEFDESGKAIRVTGTSQDITERKTAQLALLANERRNKLLLESTNVVAWELNPETFNFTYVTPQAESLLGFPLEQWYSPKFWETRIHPEDREHIKQSCSRAIEAGFDHELTYRMLDCDNNIVWVRDVVSVLVDSQGKPNNVVGVFVDITKLKTAEKEQLEMERRLQETQRLKSLGILAGGIAHDFNNILVAIMGNAELASIDAPSELQPQLQEIISASERAAKLSKQMLAYSGRGRFVIEAFDLSVLVAETSQVLKAALPQDVTIESHSTTSLPKVKIDVNQIRQVLMNLLTNASDAMSNRPGNIEITTGVERWSTHRRLSVGELEPGEYVYFQVEDRGWGMDESTRSRLFEPFFTTKGMGRGLGLAATLGIVRGHGGGIDVKSAPGVGTEIRVFLPVCDEAPLAPGSQGEAPRVKAQGTILVVDDEPSIRKLAMTCLEKSGWQVLSAKDGLEALEIFKDHEKSISAVLLDQSMPRLNGAETLQRLYQINPGVRVLMSSGYDQENVVSDSSRAPAGFLGKPYRPNQLVEAIGEIVNRP